MTRCHAIRNVGEEKLKESPVYRGIKGEGERDAILLILRDRFGPDLPEDLLARLNRLWEPRQLEPLALLAHSCPRLEEFHAALPPLLRRRTRPARP